MQKTRGLKFYVHLKIYKINNKILVNFYDYCYASLIPPHTQTYVKVNYVPIKVDKNPIFKKGYN